MVLTTYQITPPKAVKVEDTGHILTKTEQYRLDLNLDFTLAPGWGVSLDLFVSLPNI